MKSRITGVLIFALISPIFISISPAVAAVNWTKIYETTTSRRSDSSASSTMTYTAGYGKTGGAADTAINSSMPWDRIKIRMEMTQASNSTKYYAEVAFDKWSGATIAGLQFPDYVNTLVVNRNITNLVVTSDTTSVKTGSFALGRLEIWPYSYTSARSGLTPVGDNATYDFDDTYAVDANGHGSYQIHNLTDTQTIMSWGMHRSAGTQDLGLGSGPISAPDWTLLANSTWNNTGFLVQVFVGQTITATSVSSPSVTGGGAKGQTSTIKATATVNGKITFYASGKKIPSCIKVSTVDVLGTQTATCTFKPNTSGAIKYSAIFSPSDTTMDTSTSPVVTYLVGRRSGNR